jgi:hypothetical protein
MLKQDWFGMVERFDVGVVIGLDDRSKNSEEEVGVIGTINTVS